MKKQVSWESLREDIRRLGEEFIASGQEDGHYEYVGSDFCFIRGKDGGIVREYVDGELAMNREGYYSDGREDFAQMGVFCIWDKVRKSDEYEIVKYKPTLRERIHNKLHEDDNLSIEERWRREDERDKAWEELYGDM